jgi:acetolactate synthase-1/3 small subunit
MKHTLSALVENKPGVLSRISGLFTRRGFNIDSLAVSPTERPEYSRMTITVDATHTPIDSGKRSEVIELVEIFQAKIADVSADSMVIELTGESETLSRLEDLLKPLGLTELVKTGVVALGRGANPT